MRVGNIHLREFALFGDEDVGIRSLVMQYVYDGIHIYDQNTFHIKDIELNRRQYKLVIWVPRCLDTESKYVINSILKRMSGAIFVFDTTRPETLEKIEEWFAQIVNNAGRIPVVLCENKIDSESRVSQDRTNNLMNKYDFSLVRTSATQDINVDELFKTLVHLTDQEE
jgi:GTPase SAR1 family protein